MPIFYFIFGGRKEKKCELVIGPKKIGEEPFNPKSLIIFLKMQLYF